MGRQGGVDKENTIKTLGTGRCENNKNLYIDKIKQEKLLSVGVLKNATFSLTRQTLVIKNKQEWPYNTHSPLDKSRTRVQQLEHNTDACGCGCVVKKCKLRE